MTALPAPPDVADDRLAASAVDARAHGIGDRESSLSGTVGEIDDQATSSGAGPASLDNRGLRAAVDAAASSLHDASLRIPDAGALRERVRLLERLRGVATAGLADTLKALKGCGGIDDDGASSTAEWVKANTARSGHDAARIARLAIDLHDLPATRDALANGDLTDEAADAVAKAARDGRLGPPAKVDTDLVEIATSRSPEDLRADIRARQQAVDGAAMLYDERRQRARRSVRMWRDDIGMWGLSGRLPDEVGQAVRTALDAFDHPDPTPEHRRRPDQRLCDALEQMAATVLDRGLAPGTGGIARPHLSVIVDTRTISTDLTDPTADDADDADDAASSAPTVNDSRWTDLPPGSPPWGGNLSPQAVRRISCDAAVSRIVMAGPSQVLDVGRATREWSEPQRRAINARDRTCRGPNCTRPIAWTSIHHIRWWKRDRGPTNIYNGLALCHHCHRLTHDRGWTIHLDPTTAKATWTSPSGTIRITTPGARAGATSRSRTDQPGSTLSDGSTRAERGASPTGAVTKAERGASPTGAVTKAERGGSPTDTEAVSPDPQAELFAHASGGPPRP